MDERRDLVDREELRVAKSGARWGVGGWFWTAAPFPHDDATTPWTTLFVQSDGQVAVRPKAAT